MTEETQIVLPFARLRGKILQADFNGGTLTSDGGVLFLRETEAHLGVIRRFVAALDDRGAMAVIPTIAMRRCCASVCFR